jgi:hypothetical protein
VICSGLLVLAAVSSVIAHASREDTPEPVLWRDPGDIAKKDLFWGPGSAERTPKPPFTFVKEDVSGTKPKVHVVDANGATWSVKFDHRSARGREVPAEIAASRLAWALGYFAEESYFVKDGTIDKVGPLERADSVLGADGRFRAARFERRGDDVERLSKRWTVDTNPFTGSKELSGLLIVVALLNNWDFREGNTGVLRVGSGGKREDRYLITDLGTAFGGMGGGGGEAGHRSRWDLKDYSRKVPFVQRADDDALELNFRLEGTKPVRVPMEDARWLSQLASRLTEGQVRKAFEAGGATDAEVSGFSKRFLERVRELQQAVGAR